MTDAYDPMSPDPTNADLPQGNDPLEEQLVAYLDGELDDQTSRRVEQRLASDPEIRRRLEAFQRSWDLLDQLPGADVQSEFTQSTLEMVALAAAREVEREKAAAPRRRRNRWLLAASSVVVAGLVGFLAVALWKPNPNRRLLDDLPVLENLDPYRQAGEVRFLELLLEHQSDLFEEEPIEANPKPKAATRANRGREEATDAK